MTASSPIQPDWRWLRQNPQHALALGLGLGLLPKAPGTWGTLLGLPCYALSLLMPTPWAWALLALAWILGVALCERAGRALGVSDHGAIVWDEIVAMWGVLLWVAPQHWSGWLLAFGLFRLFDMTKPWPISWADRRIKGGLGVMFDDALAALFAVGVYALLHWKFRSL